MSTENEFIAKIEISGRPETNGIRVRSLYPRGLYCSCRNEAAVRSLVPVDLVHLAVEQELLTLRAGETLGAHIPDWDALIAAGGGDITLERVVVKELREKGELLDRVHESSLGVGHESGNTPDGRKIFIIRDQDDIDAWIIDAIQEDININ